MLTQPVTTCYTHDGRISPCILAIAYSPLTGLLHTRCGCCDSSAIENENCQGQVTSFSDRRRYVGGMPTPVKLTTAYLNQVRYLYPEPAPQVRQDLPYRKRAIELKRGKSDCIRWVAMKGTRDNDTSL